MVIHVYDVSHPDNVAQRQNVEETLEQMSLSETLQDNIIEVANKVDLLEEWVMDSACCQIATS